MPAKLHRESKGDQIKRLRLLCHEVIDLYEGAEIGMVYEFSSSIYQDVEEVKRECDALRERAGEIEP